MLTSHVNFNPRQMNFSTCLLRSPFNCLLFLPVIIKLLRLVVNCPSASCLSLWCQSPTASEVWSVTDTRQPDPPPDSWLISPLRLPRSFTASDSADRENVINPIRIKRGYDKWWALVLSPIISTIIISLNNFFVDFVRPWPGFSLPILMVTITFEGLI